MARQQLIDNVRNLLQDVLNTRFTGAAYSKLARAQGYADGYMRALEDAGVVERNALLEVTGDTRREYVDAA